MTQHYTVDELAEFRELVEWGESADQMDRIRSRARFPAFIERVGKDKCDAMFEVLKAETQKASQKSEVRQELERVLNILVLGCLTHGVGPQALLQDIERELGLGREGGMRPVAVIAREVLTAVSREDLQGAGGYDKSWDELQVLTDALEPATHLVHCRKEDLPQLRLLTAFVGRYFDEGRCAEVHLGTEGLAALEPYFDRFTVKLAVAQKDGSDCFYSPDVGAIDFVDCLGRSFEARLTLVQTQQKYPDVRIVSAKEAIELEAAKHVSTVLQEIGPNDYQWSLDCMPPLNWHKCGDSGECFMLGEAYSYNVHSIYVRQGRGDDARYFTFKDRKTLTPDQIQAKVESFLAQGRVEPMRAAAPSGDVAEP